MIRYNLQLLAVILALSPIASAAQQVADTLFNPLIANPAYDHSEGPVVLIDEAHGNFHTSQGRFSAFSRVLAKDGYVVKGSSRIFSSENLQDGKIMVVANALHPSNQQQWALPTPSAFTDKEIEEMNAWVSAGGSLFLIADHMPFPGAAEKLAASFGFKFYNGFATKGGGKDIFTLKNGLNVGTLTEGRNESEKITSLQSFTGQAFEIPAEAQAIIVLDSRYELRMPEVAWVFNKTTPVIPAEHLVQGAYMYYGKGRIVMFGEAAMFTAQLQGDNKVGMNQASASQNVQFLLNTIHWLDGILK